MFKKSERATTVVRDILVSQDTDSKAFKQKKTRRLEIQTRNQHLVNDYKLSPLSCHSLVLIHF